MPKPTNEPIFVDRKTAAARMMISVDTFDTWLRAGFVPAPHIDRGQIVRWHWPSLEEHLLGPANSAAAADPSVLALSKLGHDRANHADALTGRAAEMARQYAAAKIRWKAELPSTPLSKRERYCLSQLGGVAAGATLGLDDIRGVSFGTAERLEIRGLIERISGKRTGWKLTKTGAKAVLEALAGNDLAARR